MKTLALVAAVCVAGSAFADGPTHYRGGDAVTKPGARASLTPDGPWLPGRAHESMVLGARDTVGPRPQLEINDDRSSVDLWLYADPDGLADVATAETFLAASADHVGALVDDHTPGMPLDAGSDFTQVTPDGKLARVKLVRGADDPQSGRLEVTGYVSASLIGKTFASTDRSFTIRAPDVSLRSSFELLDAPGGKPFATVKGSRYARAARLDRRGGYTLVQLEFSGVVGWVANAKLRRLGPQEPPLDAGSLTGGEPPTTTRTLALHTPLYDGIDGHVIGEVSGYFDRPVLEHARGWSRFEVHTGFGIVPVWAKAP